MNGVYIHIHVTTTVCLEAEIYILIEVETGYGVTNSMVLLSRNGGQHASNSCFFLSHGDITIIHWTFLGCKMMAWKHELLFQVTLLFPYLLLHHHNMSMGRNLWVFWFRSTKCEQNRLQTTKLSFIRWQFTSVVLRNDFLQRTFGNVNSGSTLAGLHLNQWSGFFDQICFLSITNWGEEIEVMFILRYS